jgi:hypothetical protein
MGVLILTEAGVGGGYAYIGGKVKFVAHVPGVTMNHDDERLREDGRRPGQGVDRSAFRYAGSIGGHSCLKGIDINAP